MKIDCTKIEDYRNEKRRMTKRTRDGKCHIKCEDCPFDIFNNGKRIPCLDFEAFYHKDAVAIVQKWSDEHPII